MRRGRKNADEIADLRAHHDAAGPGPLALAKVFGQQVGIEVGDAVMPEILLKSRQVGGLGTPPRPQRVNLSAVSLDEASQGLPPRLHDA